jgi:hypothetical protein
MRINLNATVDTEDGPVQCSEAEVSVAVSNSVAIRIVPVDGGGNEYPLSAIGVVGTSDQEDIAQFMSAVTSATIDLLEQRGI